VAEPLPDLLSELQGLQDALGKADDPRGHWLQLLERCKAAQLRYPDTADSIAYLARAIPDATTTRPDGQTLRDRLHKATGAPKRWTDDLIKQRASEQIQQQRAAEAERIANLPEPTPAELEAQQQAEETERLSREAAAPYRVLGWDSQRRRIWFQHRQSAQISSTTPGPSFDRLLPLGPLEYWESTFPADRRAGGVDWSRAVSDLAVAADRAGVFDPAKVRGRGVWRDGGRIVWHLGDRLEVDGIETPLSALESSSHYLRLPALAIDPAAATLSDEHGQQILQLIERMGWSGPSDHLLLAGWFVLSNVCGALHKRPGLQISSGFGTGKSDTADNVIRPLQAGLGISCSGSTEAGIRQSIRHDVLPVLVDESEQADGSRRAQQLRLVRLAYDGQPMVKGTPHGEALEFTLRVAICLAGINAPIDNPADLSRIAVIGRRQLPGPEWQQIAAERAELVTIEAGQRLIRRTVSNLQTLLANIETMGRVLAAMAASCGSGRVGDTYGALLAGAHLLGSTEWLSDAAALAWLDSVGWNPAAPAADGVDRSADAEARQCLDHLLSHDLPWRDPDDRERSTTGRITVRELLELALRRGAPDAPEALGRLGLKADPERGVLVVNSGASIEPIFRGSKWSQGAHRARLLELAGAEPVASPPRFPVLGSRRCVSVPWDLVDLDGPEQLAA
jgi:putative DNA primase/helicase